MPYKSLNTINPKNLFTTKENLVDMKGRLKMNLKKIHHVAIIVSDYKKSREFYVEKLGFRVIRENYRPEREDYKLDLELDGCELEIFSGKGNPPRVNYPEACGLRHLAFYVEDMEKSLQNFTRKELKQNQFEKILLQKKE